MNVHGRHLHNKVLNNASYFYYQQKQKMVCFTMLIILFQLLFLSCCQIFYTFCLVGVDFIRKLVKS